MAGGLVAASAEAGSSEVQMVYEAGSVVEDVHEGDGGDGGTIQ